MSKRTATSTTPSRQAFFVLSVTTLLFVAACKSSDDGTGSYPTDDQLVTLTELDKDISESSGIAILGDSLITHNDSDGDPRLYYISQTEADVIEKIPVADAMNRDWEDLAQDAQYVYIGDFGNNSGNLRNLNIYRVPISSIHADDATAEKTTFGFPDQIRFDYNGANHNFDCEAMVAMGDSLYLFSKNHADKQTKLYSLPKVPGTYDARLIESFDTDGKITAAALNADASILCLLGYNKQNDNFQPFIWLFYDFPSADFFSGKHQRVNLPINTQTEGICHQQGNFWLITSEKESGGTNAELYRFDSGPWVK